MTTPDLCPRCHHTWHGLTCQVTTYKYTLVGPMDGDPCDCPGQWVEDKSA